MSLSSRLGFVFLAPTFVIAACTSFGTSVDDTPATPDGSLADTSTTTPDTGVVVPPTPTTVPDATPPVDAGKGFCSGFPGALFCASFDGTAPAEGWDTSRTELGTLALVPSTKSAPTALRARVTGEGNPNRPITYAATPALSWKGNGVVVDVDIDATGIPIAATDFYSAVNVALSVNPPRFITLAFTGGNTGALFVFDRPDASTVVPSKFQRPANGFAHYTIRAYFTQGTVTVSRDGTEVVMAAPGLTAASVQPVFMSAGLEVDPGNSGYVDYDNYVVRQF